MCMIEVAVATAAAPLAYRANREIAAALFRDYVCRCLACLRIRRHHG